MAMHFLRGTRGLRIQMVTQESHGSAKNKGDFYTVAANADLWDMERWKPTRRLLTLERIFTGAGASIDYVIDRNDLDKNELRLIQVTNGYPPEVTVDSLNRRITEDSRPSAYVVRSKENPGLLRAHRTSRIGAYTLQAISDLPTVERAVSVDVGNDSIYPKDTLIHVLARASLATAQRQIRGVLRL